MAEFSQSPSGIYRPGNGHPRALLESERALLENYELLTERITELELALEDRDWYRLSGDAKREFSREGLHQIVELARIFYLKNPLIQRGVNVQRDYVFGQGLTIRADDPDVDAVVKAFIDDSKNQAELTSHQALLYKEVDLTVEGNVFFVFFPNPATGRVRVRTIPFDEIVEKYTNPEDAKEPWYYKRVWSSEAIDPSSGVTKIESRTAYYPDWRYRPVLKPATIGGAPVNWASPVYHVRVGGFSDNRYGVSEVYAALDWAKAYKAFLEDWATIVRAYSRFAWQLTTKGGKAGIAAAKTKLASTLTASGATETNPAPVTGSTFISGENVNMTPLRTAGATTSAEDGRRLLLMVAATLGLPESFFGDVSVGTLATAKSLDRPTELKFRSRQTLWADVLGAILAYVVYWAVRAQVLPGEIVEDDDGTPTVTVPDAETGEMVKPAVTINFPPILEHDVQASVAAITQAATLGGSGVLAGTIDDKTVSRLLLQALGVDDIESVLDQLFPEDGAAAVATPAAESQMVEAVRDLRQALVHLRENGTNTPVSDRALSGDLMAIQSLVQFLENSQGLRTLTNEMRRSNDLVEAAADAGPNPVVVNVYPEINIPETVVNIKPAVVEVTNEISVPPAAVQVSVPPAQVTIATPQPQVTVNLPEQKTPSMVIKRDSQGRITGLQQE